MTAELRNAAIRELVRMAMENVGLEAIRSGEFFGTRQTTALAKAA